MDLLKIHDAVRNDLGGKDRTAHLTPEEIDAALDRAQMREFRYLIGDERGYQQGRPQPTVAYGMSRKIETVLNSFRVKVRGSTGDYHPVERPHYNGPDGIQVLPDDFEYMLSIVLRNEKSGRVKLIDEDELWSVMDSEIVAPTSDHPVAILAGAGGTVNSHDINNHKIQYFPEEGIYVTYWYLRRPAAPSMSYTMSGRTFTYDSAASTQMEWPDLHIERIIQRAVALLSKNMQRRDITVSEIQENDIS